MFLMRLSSVRGFALSLAWGSLVQFPRGPIVAGVLRDVTEAWRRIYAVCVEHARAKPKMDQKDQIGTSVLGTRS